MLFSLLSSGRELHTPTASGRQRCGGSDHSAHAVPGGRQGLAAWCVSLQGSCYELCRTHVQGLLQAALDFATLNGSLHCSWQHKCGVIISTCVRVYVFLCANVSV